MSASTARSAWRRAKLMPLAALVLAAAAAPALPVHVGGRAVLEADGAYRFGWPGVYFEARFWGTAVTVEVESSTDFLRVLVDGRERMLLRQPRRAPLTISGLGPGEHVVR